jgi:ubiquilin
MNQLLADPRMIDYLIQSQPQLQAMGPNVRQLMQSEEFRRTMTDPNALRNMMEMNRMMQSMGVQIPGMPPTRPAAGGFPAPGVTNTTPQGAAGAAANIPRAGSPPQQQQPQQPPPYNPFDALLSPNAPPAGGVTNNTNPFMNLFLPPFGVPPQQQQQQPSQQQVPPQQPFATQGMQSPPLNPQMNQQRMAASPPPQAGAGFPGAQNTFGTAQGMPNMADMYSMFNQLMAAQGGVGGANPMSSIGIPPALARPSADARPIEERYQVFHQWVYG